MRFHRAYVLVIAAGCGHVPFTPGDGPGGDGPQVLTVSVTGGGNVTSAPVGITCGAACMATFDAHTAVTLTANPDAGSAFTGWGGDCSGLAACTVTMDSAKTVSASFALHGSRRWVKQIGFSGFDSIEKVAVAPDGNVVAAGTITDGSANALYIIKYAASDGHTLWERRIDIAVGGANFGGLTIDATGEVYFGARLLGDGSTPVTIGTQNVVGDLFGNIIVVRLAGGNGAPVWAKQWGGNGQDFPKALAVSGTDLYVVGETSSSPATFDSKSFSGSTGNGFVVRAATSNGTAAELKQLPGSVQIFGAAVNGTHVAVVGSTTTAMTLDTRCSLSPSGAGSDGMILDLLGSTLVCQWGKNFGDSVANNTATTKSVAAFPGGGWVISGDFKGSILLASSGASLTSRGDFDVFAGRFAGDGTHIWSFRYGDTGFDLGDAITVTPEGNVLLTGTFNTSITFGPFTVNGKMNTFVTRMSPGTTPTHEWAVSLGGDDYDLGESVAVAPDGSVYALSLFNGMTTVAGTSMTSQDYDCWIAALVR